MTRSIDLNSDLGESFGPWTMGNDAAMLKVVNSANIACGGHASDPETMFQTLTLARENGVTAGTKVSYVKPHGALGNLAAADNAVATAIVAAVRAIDRDLAFLAISGQQLEVAARDAGAPVYSEIFADRGYLSSGQLVPRGTEGAMIHDADKAADRLLSVLETGKMPVIDGDPIVLAADSICVHGDGPSAVAMAQAIHARLSDAGILLQSFCAA